jgi:hypothetical protein
MATGIFRKVTDTTDGDAEYYLKLNNNMKVEGVFKKKDGSDELEAAAALSGNAENETRVKKISSEDYYVFAESLAATEVATAEYAMVDNAVLDTRKLSTLDDKLAGTGENLTQDEAALLFDIHGDHNIVHKEKWLKTFRKDYLAVQVGEDKRYIHYADIFRAPGAIITAIDLTNPAIKEAAKKVFGRKVDKKSSDVTYLELLTLRQAAITEEPERFRHAAEDLVFTRAQANALIQRVSIAIERGLGKDVQKPGTSNSLKAKLVKPNRLEKRTLKQLKAALILINNVRPDSLGGADQALNLDADEKSFLNLYLIAVEQAAGVMRDQTLAGPVEKRGKLQSQTGSVPAKLLEEAIECGPISQAYNRRMSDHPKFYAIQAGVGATAGFYVKRDTKDSVEALSIARVDQVVDLDTADASLALTSAINFFDTMVKTLEKRLLHSQEGEGFRPKVNAKPEEADAPSARRILSELETARETKAFAGNGLDTSAKVTQVVRGLMARDGYVDNDARDASVIGGGAWEMPKHGSYFSKRVDFFKEHKAPDPTPLSNLDLPNP